MDWGFLQGLGQGLQKIGGDKMEADAESRRQALAEKLQIDRENREEERKRTRPDPSQTTFEEGEGGVTWKVIRSATGNELERVLANKTDIEKIKRDTEKENLTIDSLKTQIEANKATVAEKQRDYQWEGEDRGLLTPAERARVARIKGGLEPDAGEVLSANTSIKTAVTRASGKDDTDDATVTDFAKSYIDTNPAVKADFVDTKKLTETQLLASVQRVLQEFVKRGVKPTEQQVRSALEKEAAAQAKNKPKTGGIKTSLTGQ